MTKRLFPYSVLLLSLLLLLPVVEEAEIETGED